MRLMLLTLALFALSASAASNLLVRTDFPSDGLGGVADWSLIFGVADGKGFTREPGVGPGGADAVRIDFRETNYLRQEGIRLVAGEPYHASVWVRTRQLPTNHTYRLLAWPRPWSTQFIAARFPADTAGEWRLVEWRGVATESREGTYSFAIAGGAPDAPPSASLEIAAPSLVPDSLAAAAKSAPPEQTRTIRPRIVPIDPLLAQVDQADCAITFYYPGDLDLGLAAYELVAVFDGSALPAQPIGADRRVRVDFGKGRSLGEHRIEVAVRECASGREIARDGYPIRVRSFPTVPPPRRLNNLVAEIVRQPLKDGDISFGLRRDGWLFIGLDADLPGVTVFLDGIGIPVLRHREGEPMETMRYVAAGRHRLRVEGSADRAATIVVRSVKRIVHSSPNFDRSPSNLDRWWLFNDFYSRFGMLNFFNVALGWEASRNGLRPMDSSIPYLEERGCWAVSSVALTPWDERRNDPDAIVRFLTGLRGYRTGLDLILDETSIVSPRLSKTAFAEGLWRLIDGVPAVNVFYNDAVDHVFTDAAAHATELAAIVNSGEGRGMIHPETYAAALADERDARHWEGHFLEFAKSVGRIVPAARDRIVWYFGTFLTLGNWTDWPCPEADIRVMYARFFHRIATDPEYAPYIGGIAAGNFRSTDEDVARWMRKLVRYYAIEGGTEYLPPKYGLTYNPGHLRNCDFAEGLTNWTVRTAAADSLRALHVKNYGNAQQERKKAPRGTGDGLALFIRSATAPNRLSQTAHGLEPGKIYSLTYCTSDYDDFKSPHAVKPDFGCRVVLDGARPIPELGYAHTSSRKPGFKTWRGVPTPLCVTRRIVFTADRPDVTVTFTDWAEDGRLGAPAGSGVLLNWIHLHRYFLEQPTDLDALIETFGRPRVK